MPHIPNPKTSYKTIATTYLAPAPAAILNQIYPRSGATFELRITQEIEKMAATISATPQWATHSAKKYHFSENELIALIHQLFLQGEVNKFSTPQKLAFAVNAHANASCKSVHTNVHANKHKVHQRPKLTKREKDVLQQILQENTNAEIAEYLGISCKTVEAHKANLFQKFGTRNTPGLLLEALNWSF